MRTRIQTVHTQQKTNRCDGLVSSGCGFTSSGRVLTITGNHGILPVVAVMYAPAGEGTVLEVCLVAKTLHVVHPDGAGAPPLIPGRAGPQGIRVPQHPGIGNGMEMEDE